MSLGSHQQTIGKSQVHLTPKWIIEALGPFDLDPCAADPRPWDCATRNVSRPADGLSVEWGADRVFLNPPFDRREVARWIGRLADHGRGTALLHARTETEWFRPIWRRATLVCFMYQRLTFYRPDGTPCTVLDKATGRRTAANSGAPPVLVAFGDEDARRLRDSGIEGAYVESWTSREAEEHPRLFPDEPQAAGRFVREVA